MLANVTRVIRSKCRDYHAEHSVPTSALYVVQDRQIGYVLVGCILPIFRLVTFKADARETWTKVNVPVPFEIHAAYHPRLPLWIAAPVQGTGYLFPQAKEQVRPVGRTGHQSRVKEQVTDFIIPLS